VCIQSILSLITFTAVYIRFPVDSSQIPKGVVYFSPGCQMTLSPSVSWHPRPWWPSDQRHPVIRTKQHHSMNGLIICTFGHHCHIVWSPLNIKNIVIRQNAKITFSFFKENVLYMKWVRVFLLSQKDYTVLSTQGWTGTS